jgi:IS605 OrfB family transposase
MKGGEIMKLSFKLYMKLSSNQLAIVEELSYHTSKLYNIANYECRENGFMSYRKMNDFFRSNWHKEYMHSHTYQQMLRVLEKDWKSFFKASEDYGKNPQKYKGKPAPPRFKNPVSKKSQVIFTNYAIRTKGNVLKLSLAKALQTKFNVKCLDLELPMKAQERLNMDELQQAKLAWDNSKKEWYLLIIYKQEEQNVDASFTNVMAIDLGLDNLCGICFKDSQEQILINGKTLKSRNAYYNKEIARLSGIRMKQVGSSSFKRSCQLNALQKKRNDYIHDALHKVSRQVISMAQEHRCNTIAIGDIAGIKQGSHIKSFVQIPIAKLVKMVEYKAKLLGIEVVKVKENYTSGVSAYDLEPITKEYYNKSRRVKRGLFRTNEGHLVNSDINGSLNILRRYLKDNVVPMPIRRLRDNGCLDHPVRIQAT